MIQDSIVAFRTTFAKKMRCRDCAEVGCAQMLNTYQCWKGLSELVLLGVDGVFFHASVQRVSAHAESLGCR